MGSGTGRQIKPFTAIERASRQACAMAAHRLSTASARRFPDKLLADMPFAVYAIQTDGGSEFMGAFKAAREARAIPLWVLAPKSPGMNGHVERMQATWRHAFHAVHDPPHQIERCQPLNDAFAERDNRHRPHDASDRIAPLE